MVYWGGSGFVVGSMEIISVCEVASAAGNSPLMNGALCAHLAEMSVSVQPGGDSQSNTSTTHTVADLGQQITFIKQRQFSA